MTSRKILLLFSFVLATLSFVSCDIIEEPFMTSPSGNGANGEVVRKVLLEEFTGHQCPNCPEGSTTAEALKDIFGDQLVIISIHSGFFARTTPPDFTADYRTAAGDEISSHFGISFNPSGMVNRKKVSGCPILSPGAWGGVISEILDEEPLAGISISLDYKPSDRQLETTIEVDFLLDIDGPIFLVAFLVEDNLVSPQKTNDPQYPEGFIPDYVHRHVLRAAINGTWGEKICDTAVNVSESISKGFNITLNEDWDSSNCSVVAYVYHGVSLEVIQAEKKMLN